MTAPGETVAERDGVIRTCPNPVFVIGSPRSGTSVLPWALAHHPAFWTSEETEFIHGLFGEGEANEVYESLRQKPATFIYQYGVDHREFYSSLGLGINALISSRSEGRRWVDQSPGYTTMVWLLADMFPGASFIHMVRDGRAVVNSMLNFGERLHRPGRHRRATRLGNRFRDGGEDLAALCRVRARLRRPQSTSLALRQERGPSRAIRGGVREDLLLPRCVVQHRVGEVHPRQSYQLELRAVALDRGRPTGGKGRRQVNGCRRVGELERRATGQLHRNRRRPSRAAWLFAGRRKTRVATRRYAPATAWRSG